MNQFTKDSVVCFFGDSITANGHWIRRIYDYYRLEQEIPCRFYNCGIPGDRAEHGLWRMDDTVFCYRPTHVVIAFGMNDSAYSTYRKEPLTERHILERRRRLDDCLSALRMMVERCKNMGIQVILCTPTLTDELSAGEKAPYYGAAAALMEIGLRIQGLARKLEVDAVDFTFPFHEVSLSAHRENRTLVGADRVHPIAEGHELMARLFLQAQGFPVEIPQTWEQLHALAQRPFDAWENRRCQLETEAKANMYVEWRVGFGRKTRQAMDSAIAYKQSIEKRDFVQNWMSAYLATRDQTPEKIQKLIDYTEAVGRDTK